VLGKLKIRQVGDHLHDTSLCDKNWCVDVESVIAEQVAYYRARADEYDDWWERRHQFDDGPEFARAWRRDIDELRAWLDDAAPLGDVLELAAGTGNWTAELARHATSVTAVDASEEVLAINAAKVRDSTPTRIEYIVADLFNWEPTRTYDTIFFGFWMSHVPESRWPAFWDLVDRALEPTGQVLFCDSAHPDHFATTSPPRTADRPASARNQPIADSERAVRTYEIVKRYWRPADIERDLASRGWTCTAAETTFAFLHGTARRRPGSTRPRSAGNNPH
jgi:demethylmenaquinone methyltransferase/2-methoxy-6-polyprenyl-1,4-benzoquinol methylase